MPSGAPNFLASGSIYPSRFVKINTATDKAFTVIQCTADSDRIIGISQVGTHQPPGVTGSDGYAAHDGEMIRVFSEGEEAVIQLGTGGCTAGDYLKSDGSGQGITATFAATTTYYFGAQALDTALAGELVRVLVTIGPALK